MYSIKKDNKIKKEAKDWEKEKLYLNLLKDILHLKELIKNKYKLLKRKLTTTKFLMFFLFFSCSFVELFTIYITIKIINIGLEIDLTPLTMLITAIVALVIGFAIYSLKSTKENTKGGIVYLTAIMQALDKQKNKYEEVDDEENITDELEVQG